MKTLEQLDRMVADWVKQNPQRLAETAKRAKAASQQVLDDARVTTEQLRRPTTI